MADSPSVFEQLLDFRWRNIVFPARNFRLALEQDHAEHRWPDRDGAHIEATGRCPLVFTAKAVFRNGVKPGAAEKFGVLYPTQYRDFLVAVADRTTGNLQHPELGTIKCKVKSAITDWEAGARDGVDVDVTWIESTDTPEDLNAALAAPSPIASTLLFSADMDNQISQLKATASPTLFAKVQALKPPLPDPAKEGSFQDAIRTIQSAFDQTTLLSRRIGGAIDHVAYRVNALSNSIDTLNDVGLWPIRQSIEHMKSSLIDLKKQLLTTSRSIAIYIVPRDQTLGQINATLGTKVDDMIKLNPDLVTFPVIPERSVVRYYKIA